MEDEKMLTHGEKHKRQEVLAWTDAAATMVLNLSNSTCQPCKIECFQAEVATC